MDEEGEVSTFVEEFSISAQKLIEIFKLDLRLFITLIFANKMSYEIELPYYGV